MAQSTTGPTNDVSTADARALLADLVSIPAPSGEETAAGTALAAFFDAHDREVWLDDVGNVRAPADDSVLLTSHVDTVPGDVPTCITGSDATAPVSARDAAACPTTTDATAPVSADDAPADADAVELPSDGTALTDDDAVLWGRGSVDATGPLAAMAVAAVETGVSFVGVVGEETDSRGARHLVADRDAPDVVVNGEPSGWDALTLGYRGFLPATYTVSTTAGHSSRPDANAVQHATAWVERVQHATAWVERVQNATAWVERVQDAVDRDTAGESASVFDSVTVKPVAFEGGVADDGRTVDATVDCQFRIPPSSSASEIRDTVAALTPVGDLAWGDAIPPHTASPRSDVARAFRVAIRDAGGDPSLLRKTGTADANLYDDAWSCPVATYGPGDSSLDHAPDEHLALADYDRAIAVLQSVANDRSEH